MNTMFKGMTIKYLSHLLQSQKFKSSFQKFICKDVHTFYKESVSHKYKTIRKNVLKDAMDPCHDPEMTFCDFLELSINKNKNFKLPWLKHEIDMGTRDILKKISNGC